MLNWKVIFYGCTVRSCNMKRVSKQSIIGAFDLKEKSISSLKGESSKVSNEIGIEKINYKLNYATATSTKLWWNDCRKPLQPLRLLRNRPVVNFPRNNDFSSYLLSTWQIKGTSERTMTRKKKTRRWWLSLSAYRAGEEVRVVVKNDVKSC